jgi:CRP-like cAMP-binding protein
MKIKRTASVQAKTPCILGILKRSDIESILNNYPKVAAEFIKEANRRIKEMYKMNEEKLSMNSKITPNQSFGTDNDFLHDSREDNISHPENVDQSFR